MTDVLNLCRSLPELQVAAGHVLIEEGVPMGRVYVLKEGAFQPRARAARPTRGRW